MEERKRKELEQLQIKEQLHLALLMEKNKQLCTFEQLGYYYYYYYYYYYFLLF